MDIKKFVTMIVAANSGAAPVVPWYLAGGVDAVNCVAAYKARGAESFDASKINLVNSETHGITNGTAYPTWAANSGWSFSASTVQWLVTDIIPTSTNWSAILHFAGRVNSAANWERLLGAWGGVAQSSFEILAKSSGPHYRNGEKLEMSVPMNYGVLAIAGKAGFRNGVKDGDIGAGNLGAIPALYIGATNVGNGAPERDWTYAGDILELAIYNTVLTDAQVLAISDEMQNF